MENTFVAEDSLETELQKIRVGLQTLGMHFMVEQLGWRRLEKTVKAVDETNLLQVASVLPGWLDPGCK